ncbi:MAG: hypothetical protein GY934_11840 [Gammaproteobacteria bacterium]|nr:hypothetical protein [Gammaproteobacteria bacterium]
MAIRIKSQWHDEDTKRSMKEIAGAIAFNGWKLAMDRAINLHGEQYIYQSDQQRLNAISTYLIYMIQLVDRIIQSQLEPEERQTLITALVLKLADHVQDNGLDLLGSGDYHTDFIQRFNQQSADYGEQGFTSDGPTYPFFRHFGYELQQVMGESQENRWVIDQAMDKDGPEIYKQIKKIVRNLFY